MSQASWPVSPERKQVRVLDLEPRRQRIGDDEPRLEIALRRHRHHRHQPVVERDGGRVGRRAVQRQELPLDAVAVALRRLRLGRHAEGGDDGERRLGPGVRHPDGQVGRGEAQGRAGRGSAVHQQRADRRLARQGVGGEKRPELLLGRALDPGCRHDRGERLPVDRVAAGFDGEREHPGGVARTTAVVGAVELLRLARRGTGAGAPEHCVSARLIASERERGAELGLGERGREGIRLRVGVVAEVADRRPALAREHHEGIGEYPRRPSRSRHRR